MSDEKLTGKFTRRAIMFGGMQALAFSVIGARLYQLQVVEADLYRTLAEDNRINLELLPPVRGRILDRFGRELARNQRTHGVILIPEQTNGVEATLDQLARLVPISDDVRQRVIKDVSRNRSFTPITVINDMEWQAFAKVNVNSPDLPGVHSKTGYRRDYLGGESLSHLLGYVGYPSGDDQQRDPDPLLSMPGFQIGRRGLERQFDQELRGKAGNRQVEVNALGRVIRELEREEGEAGQDLVLTIDADLQDFSAARFEGETGAAVLLDVANGDVLAMTSTPGFDANKFATGISTRDWRKLVDDPRSPLLNKAVQGRYPPGSTFKIAVLAAALEAGVTNDTRKIMCSGHIEMGGHRFHCWHRFGHGLMNAKQAMRESCDVYFYQIAREVGIDRIADMSRRLGLGQLYEIGLPEQAKGLIPDRNWKQAVFGQPWQVGETFIAGIGQGFVTANALELAVMTARVANTELRAVKPRLVVNPDELTPDFPELPVKSWIIDRVRDSLDAVTNHPAGTAFEHRMMWQHQEMAGKTGTAQVRRITQAERDQGVLSNDQLPWSQRDHALFVGYAPVDKPRYAVSVIVEHGGSGSSVAAPIARDLLIAALQRDSGAQPSREGAPVREQEV